MVMVMVMMMRKVQGRTSEGRRRRVSAAVAVALLPLVSVGCLFAGGVRRIESDESARILVRFSGVEASREFHDALERSDPEPYTDMGGFVVPFVAARGEGVYHETLHYNAAARIADVDRDGRITQEEARDYAAWVDGKEGR